MKKGRGGGGGVPKARMEKGILCVCVGGGGVFQTWIILSPLYVSIFVLKCHKNRGLLLLCVGRMIIIGDDVIVVNSYKN